MAELLGTFEQIILLAVMTLEEDAYGRSVLRESQASGASERTMAAGAVYSTLDRLEEKGYLVSRLEAGMPERGGRARRFYRLTANGVVALNETRRTLVRIWRGKQRKLKTWSPSKYIGEA
ncbi:MAG: helix-turn-helix transcriptional regulator [Terracidiphilus sp.]|jgi:DNA-binding PadR family transcriptional regulator